MVEISMYQPKGWWLLCDFTENEQTILQTSFACIYPRLGTITKSVIELQSEKLQNNPTETKQLALLLLQTVDQCISQLNRQNDFASLTTDLATRYLSYGKQPSYILPLLGYFRREVIDEVEAAFDDAELQALVDEPNLSSLSVWGKFFSTFGLALIAEMMAIQQFIGAAEASHNCSKVPQKKKNFWKYSW